MKRKKFRKLFLGTAGALTVGAAVLAAGAAGGQVERSAASAARGASDPPAAARVRAALDDLPLYFIENRGQVDARVAYYVQGQDTTLYFTPEGLTYAFTGKENPTGVEKASMSSAAFGREQEAEKVRQRWVLKLDFVGASGGVVPAGQDQTPAVFSYFKGPQEEWKTALKTYGKLVYTNLWPGIDLVYAGKVNQLKYTFLVKPGADPNQIRLAYRGATSVRVNGEGQLEISTPVGGFNDEKPYSYQEVDGQRAEVATAYALEADTADGAHVYGFRLGAYDKREPLVIDPVKLLYAGYIGGSGSESFPLTDASGGCSGVPIGPGSGIDVDSAGNAYVTGTTSSTQATFPVAVGPDLTHGGGTDAFVIKVNAAGTALIYCGYIGGSSDDVGAGIAVDSNGRAYVTGYAVSTQLTFPVTGGPDLTHNGGFDAFVAKVNTSGTALIYCGYIGGSQVDVASGIAVDSAGNAYVTGYTKSPEDTFPATVGPDVIYSLGPFDQPQSPGGPPDAFVAKVDNSGKNLIYCGYIGIGECVVGSAIAVDSSERAYVTGHTSYLLLNYVTVGPDLSPNGGWDVFVARVNASGTAFEYFGYLGGDGNDFASGIAVDSGGRAYVTGHTKSNQDSFPVKKGPDLTHNGGVDAFVAKVNASGTALTYCGYIGGSGDDLGRGIAVDGGKAYVTGATSSAQASFPVKLGPDLTHNGGDADAFIAKVNFFGTKLTYCSYIGGSANDSGGGVAVDSAGNAYVTGITTSTQASFPVTVGPDLTHNGGVDAFVVKICDTPSKYGFASDHVDLLVASEAITEGVGRSLQAKLEAADQQADRGNVASAADHFKAFQKEVDALVKSGRLARRDAESFKRKYSPTSNACSRAGG